jgi:hypothetical protein
MRYLGYIYAIYMLVVLVWALYDGVRITAEGDESDAA